ANNAIIKNDLLAGVANNAVSITNGTGQIVGGLNATVNVATNALNQAGVVTGTTAANANQVWGTNGLGVPGWITPANNDWHITGNAGTAPATNFIGTTDNVDFVARTNNIERMRINNNGRVGINTASTGIGSTYPWAHIEIVGDGNTNGDILFKSVGPVTDYLTWQTAGGTFPTPAIVNNSQIIGYINWQAHNGTGFSTTAYETIFIEGAATAASLPTAINFATTPSGSTIPLERLRITNSGNIGIGTTVPDASALLQVTATNKGVILPNVALSATNTAGPITLPATTLMVYNTATAGAGATAVTPGYYYNAGTGAAPNWRRLAEGTTGWNITGNYLTGNGTLGTLSNNLIDIYSNNIFRGRISNTDGEFSWGATASPYAGDALCGVGTAALSFAVNGYSAFNGSGTWGEVLAASTTAFSAV
ncbi:MAG: hypothetical protein K1X92_15865, partial [Bacteroidia bacterium]|nr:hypothetical protein [Bacteroidia bacterium]